MLLSNKQLKQLPTLDTVKHASFNLFNAKALVKFLTPGDKWTWYALAFDGEDLCFGFINGNVPELGYFRLSALEHGMSSASHPVICDPDYQPETLRELLKRYVRLFVVIS